MELCLGFLASHRGSNVEAILRNIESGELRASARVIISNNADAGVLDIGKSRTIPSYCLSSRNVEEPDKSILETLKDHEVNVVILAGYMKLVGSEITTAYADRILNIHPALLPKYGGKGMYGMAVHEAVIKSDDTKSGATVHIATNEYDRGRILAQYTVPRFARDTAETLAARVLKIEHVLYSQTLIDIQRGIISLDS